MVKIVALLKRKQGMSKEEFRKYYEEKHIKLCHENSRGYALDYRRNYIQDQFGAGTGGSEFSSDAAAEADYDVVTEVWFRSREEIEQMLKAVQVSSIGEAMIKDEENLFDRSAHRFMICDEVISDPALHS